VANRAIGTRERILTAALHLFGTKGFRGTSVAEIEAEAGLSPGSGALYTHFRTKQEVLAAAIDRAATTTEASYSIFEVLPLDDLRSEVMLLARSFFVIMESWRYAARIMLKEAQQFPDELARGREMMVQGFEWFASWLRAKTKAGLLVDHDADAMAALYMGALSNYWIFGNVLGESPAAVDRDAFIAAWTDSLLTTLQRTA